MVIEKWTQEQLDAHQKQFPLAGKPEGPYVLKDGKDEGVVGFYPTEEEATKSKVDMELHDVLEEAYDEWVDQIAKEHNILPSQVSRIIGEYIEY